jgi:hypothetical protein
MKMFPVIVTGLLTAITTAITTITAAITTITAAITTIITTDVVTIMTLVTATITHIAMVAAAIVFLATVPIDRNKWADRRRAGMGCDVDGVGRNRRERADAGETESGSSDCSFHIVCPDVQGIASLRRNAVKTPEHTARIDKTYPDLAVINVIPLVSRLHLLARTRGRRVVDDEWLDPCRLAYRTHIA